MNSAHHAITQDMWPVVLVFERSTCVVSNDAHAARKSTGSPISDGAIERPAHDRIVFNRGVLRPTVEDRVSTNRSKSNISVSLLGAEPNDLGGMSTTGG